MFEKLKTTNNGQCSNFYGAKMSQGVKNLYVYQFISERLSECSKGWGGSTRWSVVDCDWRPSSNSIQHVGYIQQHLHCPRQRRVLCVIVEQNHVHCIP